MINVQDQSRRSNMFWEYVYTRMCPMPWLNINKFTQWWQKTNIVDNTREGDITGILLGLNLHRLFLLGDFYGEDEDLIHPMPGSLTKVFFGFEMKE